MAASCFLRLRRHTAIKYDSDNIRVLLTVGGRSIGQSPLEGASPIPLQGKTASESIRYR